MAEARVEGPLAQGMIAVRGDLGAASMAAALDDIGASVPGVAAITTGAVRAAWMAPDEALLLLPEAEVSETVARLTATFAQNFSLAVDVTGMRSLFRVTGPAAREVAAKLCPVDMAPEAFGETSFRRTRAAQVSAALWLDAPDAIAFVVLRSVETYMADLLRLSAEAPIGLWR